MPTNYCPTFVAASASEPPLLASLALAATPTKPKQASRYRTHCE